MAKKILLKQFRVAHGDATQTELANEIGVPYSYYTRVERGELCGNVEFWTKLQARFNVSDGDIWRMMKE